MIDSNRTANKRSASLPPTHAQVPYPATWEWR